MKENKSFTKHLKETLVVVAIYIVAIASLFVNPQQSSAWSEPDPNAHISKFFFVPVTRSVSYMSCVEYNFDIRLVSYSIGFTYVNGQTLPSAYTAGISDQLASEMRDVLFGTDADEWGTADTGHTGSFYGGYLTRIGTTTVLPSSQRLVPKGSMNVIYESAGVKYQVPYRVGALSGSGYGYTVEGLNEPSIHVIDSIYKVDTNKEGWDFSDITYGGQGYHYSLNDTSKLEKPSFTRDYSYSSVKSWEKQRNSTVVLDRTIDFPFSYEDGSIPLELFSSQQLRDLSTHGESKNYAQLDRRVFSRDLGGKCNKGDIYRVYKTTYTAMAGSGSTNPVMKFPEVDNPSSSSGTITVRHSSNDGRLNVEETKSYQIDKSQTFNSKTFSGYKITGLSTQSVTPTKAEPIKTVVFNYTADGTDPIPTPPSGGGGGGGSVSIPDVNIPPITVPTFPGWPSWVTNPTEKVDDLPQDSEFNDGKQVDQIFDLGDSDGLQIRYSNIPTNGILNLSGTEFKPEFGIKNKNDVFEFPMIEKSDSVTQTQVDKLWAKYASGSNETTVFIYEVKDPKDLPDNPDTLFNKPTSEFAYHKVIKTKADLLTDFKIKKSGYYVLGAKVKSGAKVATEVLGVKVAFTDNFGWLPVKNNILHQVNETMLVTSWKKGSHGLGNVLLEGYKSLRVPSAFNHEYNVTALGSLKGEKGLKLYKQDLTELVFTKTLTDSSKISEVLEYKEGILASSLNNGLHYVDLKENKSFNITGVTSPNINDIYVEGNNVYIADKSGIISGEIAISTDVATKKITGVSFVKGKEIPNNEIFNVVSEVGTIEVLLNKIIVTPKNNTGTSSISIIDKY